jgi:hypothetical protein
LRAVSAVLRATPCFDAQQDAALDFVWVMKFTVNGLGAKRKIRQRQLVDGEDVFHLPIMSNRTADLGMHSV